MERFVDFHLHVEILIRYHVPSQHTPIWTPFFYYYYYYHHHHHHQKLAEAAELIDNKSPYYKYTPPNVLESENFNLYWNCSILTDKTVPYLYYYYYYDYYYYYYYYYYYHNHHQHCHHQCCCYCCNL